MAEAEEVVEPEVDVVEEEEAEADDSQFQNTIEIKSIDISYYALFCILHHTCTKYFFE